MALHLCTPALNHAIASAALPVPNTPVAAASAILRTALSQAEQQHVPLSTKTHLAARLCPLNVPPPPLQEHRCSIQNCNIQQLQPPVDIDSHALALAMANATKFESILKGHELEAAAAVAHPLAHPLASAVVLAGRVIN